MTVLQRSFVSFVRVVAAAVPKAPAWTAAGIASFAPSPQTWATRLGEHVRPPLALFHAATASMTLTSLALQVLALPENLDGTGVGDSIACAAFPTRSLPPSLRPLLQVHERASAAICCSHRCCGEQDREHQSVRAAPAACRLGLCSQLLQVGRVAAAAACDSCSVLGACRLFTHAPAAR